MLNTVHWGRERVALTDGCVLTIGVFDGVHIGHKALIATTLARASALNLPSVCISFYPSPEVVFGQAQPAYLLLPEERAEIMHQLGISLMVIGKFDREMAQMPAHEFISLLRDTFHPAALCIGEDFALGRNREGNAEVLADLGHEFGFSVHVVQRCRISGRVVSSTLIRSLLREGNVAEANRYLGYPYTISGEVGRGHGLGRKLGFPTANIVAPLERLLPADGVYSATVTCCGSNYLSVVNIGFRPTVNGSERTIEAHLLGYNGDLYGQNASVAFRGFLRQERRFANVEELSRQIAADAEAASREIPLAMKEGGEVACRL